MEEDFYKPQIRNVIKINDNEIKCEIEHPDFGWIPYSAIKDGVDETEKYVWEKAFSEDLPIDIKTNKARAVANAKLDAKDMVVKLTQKYTQEERNLWDLKRSEAEKVVAGGTSHLLDTESKLSGENILVLANKIISKSEEYRLAVVSAEALKRNIEKDSEEINTIEDLDKFKKKYEDIINSLKNKV